MSFSIKREGEVVVVDVEGQLIVGNRQELKQKVLDEMEKGEKKFLIDFSQTGYIDSSGLGVLVSLSKKIREQGGELRLANLNDDLKTLVELVRRECQIMAFDRRQVMLNVPVALTEALSNAILRGNGDDPAKQVHVRAEVDANRLIVEVGDEGPGFDLEKSESDPTTP